MFRIQRLVPLTRLSGWRNKNGRLRKEWALALWGAVIVLCASALPSFADTVGPITVPGTSDPWLAGMPNGSTASITDVAPAQSPVLVSGLALLPNSTLIFEATGGVSNEPNCPPICSGPDGTGFQPHLTGAENGIATATAPLRSLVGVFLDDNQPNLSPAPSGLDFSVIGTNFSTLSPQLKQVFFIGDGFIGTGTGAVQQFVVPPGATRLFLGTMDGFEWSNNSGAFQVEIIENQPPDCSAAEANPSELWPPNHKGVPVNIVGVTDPDDAVVSITIDSVSQDEPVLETGTGSGNTCPDAAGVGTDTAVVRAERAGNPKVPGDGRVYHIAFTADDGMGGTCTGEVTVCVPHDQRPGHSCVDQGPLFDSTVCP